MSTCVETRWGGRLCRSVDSLSPHQPATDSITRFAGRRLTGFQKRRSLSFLSPGAVVGRGVKNRHFKHHGLFCREWVLAESGRCHLDEKSRAIYEFLLPFSFCRVANAGRQNLLNRAGMIVAPITTVAANLGKIDWMRCGSLSVGIQCVAQVVLV